MGDNGDRRYFFKGKIELADKLIVKVLTPLKGVLKRVPAYRLSPVLVHERRSAENPVSSSYLTSSSPSVIDSMPGFSSTIFRASKT